MMVGAVEKERAGAREWKPARHERLVGVAGLVTSPRI